jgi:hypothetical protein
MTSLKTLLELVRGSQDLVARRTELIAHDVSAIRAHQEVPRIDDDPDVSSCTALTHQSTNKAQFTIYRQCDFIFDKCIREDVREGSFAMLATLRSTNESVVVKIYRKRDLAFETKIDFLRKLPPMYVLYNIKGIRLLKASSSTCVERVIGLSRRDSSITFYVAYTG